LILVTGGAGYIGSHTCVALAQAGRDFLILDNFSNVKRSVLERLSKTVDFEVRCVEGDVSDVGLVTRLLEEHKVSAVIHFAALKAVGESVAQPLRYYRNNVTGSIALFEAMRLAGVGTIVFSSSATVYGDPASVPITEDFPLCPTNPYGRRTKLFTEQILADLVESEPDFWRVALLRYFNPAGAHESGLIGEDPLGVPNNLVPFVAQVAAGQRPFLSVWGNDYPTRDGTGVRDYIHVMDLADGHLAALERVQTHEGLLTLNLGTGSGVSVKEVVREFERVCGRRIPMRVGPRRAGDVAQCWADPSLAQSLLGWQARAGLQEICRDAWTWQSVGAMGLDG